jgi:hypothetical protein
VLLAITTFRNADRNLARGSTELEANGVLSFDYIRLAERNEKYSSKKSVGEAIDIGPCEKKHLVMKTQMGQK